MMKKQRKKIVLCDLVEKKLRFFLLATKTKNYSKILENSQLLHTTLKTILLLYLLVFQSDEKILMHKQKKVSSIAVFMQSAMYYKLMPFWTTTKKVSLFLLLNSLSFYLLLYIFYLSLDTFLLCFVFSTSIIQAQIMLTKNAAICVKSTLVKKKLLVFTFSPDHRPCFFLTIIL